MGKAIEKAERSTLLLKSNEGDGDTVFKTCPKCGTIWKSNEHSKSRVCKRCAILESLERVRRKKGKVIICPYCGEKFVIAEVNAPVLASQKMGKLQIGDF